MQLPVEQIGLIADRSAADAIRIELAVTSDDDRDRWVMLHPDDVGTFARVFRGQLRQGSFRLPVAIKVQRDSSLSEEQSRSVAAKFDTERAVYLAFDGSINVSRIVRYYDIGPTREGTACASLPPSILCRHARHALLPRCPSCHNPLEPDAWAPHDNERALACEPCQRRFSARANHADEVLRHTVRRDPACDGCQQPDEVCRKSAAFLNFYPARVLVFELLDVDLEDFLLGSRTLSSRHRHPAFWQATRPVGELTPREELAESLHLFDQLLAGVRELHQLGAAHLDLKPRNICLRATPDGPDLRVIDLGFAKDPNAAEFLRQAQGDRKLETEYAAPEVRSPVSPHYSATAKLAKDGLHWLIIRPQPLGVADAFDPLVAPGDTVVARSSGNIAHVGQVEQVGRSDQDALALRVDWGSSPPPATAVTVALQKHVGPGSDLFSMGMILLAMLTNETRVQPIRDALPVWLTESHELSSAVPPTHRKLVELLRERPSRQLALLHTLIDRLQRFGVFAPVAMDLFGVALRLLFRDPAKITAVYLTGRTDDPERALARLGEDLAAIRRDLAARQSRADADADRDSLRRLVPRLRTFVEQRASRFTPTPNARIPAFDPEPIEFTLRQLNGRHTGEAISELLTRYGGNLRWLGEHLERYERPEQAGRAELALDQRVLVEVLRLGSQVEPQPSVLGRFGSIRDRVAEMLTKHSLNADLRRQLDAWMTAAAPLADQVRLFDEHLATIESFVGRVDRLFLKSLERERERPRPLPLEFRLGVRLREEFGDGTARDAVAALSTLSQEVQQLRARLQQRWTNAFADWEAVPLALRAALTPHATAARQRGQELAPQADEWWSQSTRAFRQLRDYLGDVKERVLDRWSRAARRRSWRRFLGGGRDARLVLHVDILDAIATRQPSEVIRELRKDLHLGPLAATQAALLIDEFRAIRALHESA